MKNDVFEIDDYLNVKKLNENNLNYIEQLDKIKKHNKEYISNQLEKQLIMKNYVLKKKL